MAAFVLASLTSVNANGFLQGTVLSHDFGARAVTDLAAAPDEPATGSVARTNVPVFFVINSSLPPNWRMRSFMLRSPTPTEPVQSSPRVARCGHLDSTFQHSFSLS